MERYDVLVIGAGPAGMTAALEAAKLNKRVLILDKNKKCGNKLYATGNGRCNVTNTVFNDRVYYEHTKEVLSLESAPDSFVRGYLEDLGVAVTEKNNYVYPLSMQASSVVWAYNDALKNLGVEVKCGFIVTDITKTKKGFSVSNGIQLINATKLILATGGLAAPNLGCANENWLTDTFKKLNIEYNSFEPALCPLFTRENLKEISGVRQRATATLIKNGEPIDEESGEIQFTDLGLSGIAIFNLSGEIREKAKYKVSLDYIQDLSVEKTREYLINYKETNGNRTVLAVLNSLIHDRTALYLLKVVGIDPKKPFSSLDQKSIDEIVSALKENCFEIQGKHDYTKSQSTLGGIKLDDIDLSTMKLTKQPDISVCGEIVDICGKCGGYNITWAMLSGYIAGRNI